MGKGFEELLLELACRSGNDREHRQKQQTGLWWLEKYFCQQLTLIRVKINNIKQWGKKRADEMSMKSISFL